MWRFAAVLRLPWKSVVIAKTTDNRASSLGNSGRHRSSAIIRPVTTSLRSSKVGPRTPRLYNRERHVFNWPLTSLYLCRTQLPQLRFIVVVVVVAHSGCKVIRYLYCETKSDDRGGDRCRLFVLGRIIPPWLVIRACADDPPRNTGHRRSRSVHRSRRGWSRMPVA